MSFPQVISLIFLTVKKINAARNLCLNVENREENVVLTVNLLNGQSVKICFSLKRVGGTKWPDSIFQALYQIGMKKQLHDDMEIDIKEKEKEFEEAGKIDNKKLTTTNQHFNLTLACHLYLS